MTSRHDYPDLPARPPRRGRISRLLAWLDEYSTDTAGHFIEWLLVCIAIVSLFAVIAIASRNIDGDLDTSAKVIEEQHERVRSVDPNPK